MAVGTPDRPLERDLVEVELVRLLRKVDRLTGGDRDPEGRGRVQAGLQVGARRDLEHVHRAARRSVAFLLHAERGLVGADATASAPVHPLPLYFALAALGVAVVGRRLDRRPC